MRISDWSSDVCSSDLVLEGVVAGVRRRADGTAGDLHVLLTQRRDHVGGGEAVGGELLRIDPDPQRELALAEEDQIADAVESQQQVAYPRSEEHTSELQSLMLISYAVFCLKKKNNHQQ